MRRGMNTGEFIWNVKHISSWDCKIYSIDTIITILHMHDFQQPIYVKKLQKIVMELGMTLSFES